MTIRYYTCQRCGSDRVAADGPMDPKTVFCGICALHLETGVIGPGIRPAVPGFVPPRWAKKY